MPAPDIDPISKSDEIASRKAAALAAHQLDLAREEAKRAGFNGSNSTPIVAALLNAIAMNYQAKA